MYKWLFLLVLPICAQTTIPEPSQFIGVGAGIVGATSFKGFGYVSFSQELTSKTYATAISEYVRLKDNTVSICPRAGLTKVMWQHGPFSAGLVGDVGACESTIGSTTNLAISGRGFGTYKILKSNSFLTFSIETVKTSGGSITPVGTIGIHYGVFK